jgi:peptidyl-prolyl cis-trans isomerase SurA
LRTLVVVLALMAALPARAAEPLLVDKVVALVNDHVITLGDVQAMIASRLQELQAKSKGIPPEDQLKKLQDEGLNVLIDRYLILDSFKETEGRIPDWAVDQEVEAVIRENFKGDRAALLAALAKDHLTFESWRTELQNHIIVTTLRSANVGQNVKILPGQVEAYYEPNAVKYTKPAQARIRVIVIPKAEGGKDGDEKRRQAQEIRQRLARGEDFGAVAKEVSKGPKAAEGGDWGWMALEDLRTELRAALAPLKPGEISEVVDTPDDVYIVKKEEQREKGPVPLQDVRSEIELELRKQESERLYDAWIERLKQKAYVKVIGIAGKDEKK